MRKRRVGPNSRGRAWVWTLLTAVVLVAIAAPLNATVYQVTPAVAIALAVTQAAAIPLALVVPRIATAVAITSALVFATISGATVAPWPLSVTNLIALVALILVLALSTNWVIATAAWLATVLAAVFALTATVPRDPAAAAAMVIVFASVSVGLLAIGILIRQRHGIRTQLMEERRAGAEAEAARALAEERNRIARELHDVVAHSMSVIQVQATSAQYRLPDMRAAEIEEFEQIAAATRQALTEMRQVLSVLRNSEDQDFAPSPGVEQIPKLIAGAEQAGLPVELEGDLPQLAGTVSLTAYRIVQESLSNIIRHEPGARSTVRLDVENGVLRIRVENSAVPGAGQTAPTGTGHGLTGMRERVSLVNGTLETGPLPDGGFRVLAHLPIGVDA